jgi:hypothetical protein
MSVRRTDEHRLRQAISEILEQIHGIEYAMNQFYRKRVPRDVERAAEDLEIMRDAVNRLGELIAETQAPQPADSNLPERVA